MVRNIPGVRRVLTASRSRRGAMPSRGCRRRTLGRRRAYLRVDEHAGVLLPVRRCASEADVPAEKYRAQTPRTLSESTSFLGDPEAASDASGRSMSASSSEQTESTGMLRAMRARAPCHLAQAGFERASPAGHAVAWRELDDQAPTRYCRVGGAGRRMRFPLSLGQFLALRALVGPPPVLGSTQAPANRCCFILLPHC